MPHWKAWLCLSGHHERLVLGRPHDDRRLGERRDSATCPSRSRRTRRSTASTSIRPSARSTAANADLQLAAGREARDGDHAGGALLARLPRVRAALPPDDRAPAAEARALAYATSSPRGSDYLAHDNDGRGVVLIGHSQGAFMLERADPASRSSTSPASGACSSRRSCSAATSSSRTARRQAAPSRDCRPAPRPPRPAASSPTRAGTTTPPADGVVRERREPGSSTSSA